MMQSICLSMAAAQPDPRALQTIPNRPPEWLDEIPTARHGPAGSHCMTHIVIEPLEFIATHGILRASSGHRIGCPGSPFLSPARSPSLFSASPVSA